MRHYLAEIFSERLVTVLISFFDKTCVTMACLSFKKIWPLTYSLCFSGQTTRILNTNEAQHPVCRREAYSFASIQ